MSDATVIKGAVAAAARRAFSVTTGVSKGDSFIKALLYGSYGAGKTILASTAVDVPEMRDVIFLNMEAGTKSIMTSGAVKAPHEIDFITITMYDQFPAVIEFLKKHCRARDNNDAIMLAHVASEFGIKPSRRYRTIIIDSISELDSMNFRRLIADKPEDLMQANPSDDLRGDYGRNRQIMHKAFRELRNLPMNVLMIAPDDLDKDDTTKKITISPKLTGKLSKEIQGYMDVVGYLHKFERKSASGDKTEEVRRLFLQASATGKYDAKCRLAPSTLTHIDNPDMAALWGALVKHKTASAKPTIPKPTVGVPASKPTIPVKRT